MKKILAFLLSMMIIAAFSGTFVYAEEPADPADDISEAADLSDALEETDEAEDSLEGVELIPVAEVNVSETGEVILEDYSIIEISAGDIAVSDFEVESYIQSIISSATTTDIITEGTAEEGDQVNINFSGIVEGEEEPGDGMVADGYDITLGSGTFIPGFEEQIIGHEIGETFDIEVTFPDDYTEELAGKNAVFTITLNNKSVLITPELNDEFVQEFSTANMDTTLNTVDELREYTHNYIYRNYLDNAIMLAMAEKETVISYNESQFEALKAYSAESLAYSVSMYTAYGMDGFTEDSIAQMYGFENAEAYTTDEALYYMDRIMLIDKVAEDLSISITDEEINDAVVQYMTVNSLDTEFDVEQFKELTGEGFLLLLTKLNVELPKVMDVLEQNVVIVEEPAEIEEEVDLESEEVEEIEESAEDGVIEE